VSSITAKESNQLLGREPDVTPNGFEEEIVPTDEKYATCRISARKRLLQIVTALTGKKPADDSLLVATSGRNEYRNKGLDLYLDSLKRVAGQYDGTRNIIAFVLVPAWAGEAREDLTVRMKKGVNNASSLNDPFITHYLYNYNEDKIVNKIRDLNFENSPEDKVKVIYIPSYLKGNDGVVNIDYYDLLPGLDITVFPSYYEPWGYTPLESIAMGVPTITTSLSGFGMWVTDEVSRDPKNSGVYVLERNDTNYNEVASKIADILIGIADMKPKGYKTLSEGAKKTSQKALWSNFIQAYLDVYQKAIKTNKKNR
ncbi:MAG: glycosyltransferase, partial [Bacteroidales bacterium]